MTTMRTKQPDPSVMVRSFRARQHHRHDNADDEADEREDGEPDRCIGEQLPSISGDGVCMPRTLVRIGRGPAGTNGEFLNGP